MDREGCDRARSGARRTRFGSNRAGLPIAICLIVPRFRHRIVMNFFTAKRLLGLLANVVQQHENNFGALELDFQKRMRGVRQVMPPAAASK
jgi:hypothetical protein